MFGTHSDRARRRLTSAATLAVICATLTTGCSQASSAPTPALLLGGPKTDITVAIPPGWHQVIDSANTPIPEMVAPVTCMGENEVDCALALTRVATMIAPSAQDAERTVEQAVLSAPGVAIRSSLGAGPTTLDNRPAYTHRFVFNNANGDLTCEIATVASGPTAPDAQGNHEFSVVVVWVANKSSAPDVEVIDRIVGSASVDGGLA